MRCVVFCVLVVVVSIVVGGCKNVPEKPKKAPIQISSAILDEKRELLVHLPATYDTTKQDYPVLYLLDGKIHFNYAVALVDFLSTWKDIPEVIVVGILQKDRFYDLSYSKDRFFEHECNAVNFSAFIEKELIPFVESSYRTNDNRILFGHSLGAMFALHTLIRKPDLFNAYIAASPCFERDTTLLPFLEKSFKATKKVTPMLYVSKEKTYSEVDSIEYEKFKRLLYNSYTKWIFKEEFLANDSHVSMSSVSLQNGLRAVLNSL